MSSKTATASNTNEYELKRIESGVNTQTSSVTKFPRGVLVTETSYSRREDDVV
jgi:hypothetical protein